MSSQQYICSTTSDIQNRLQNAQPGDRILIAPGNYLGIKAPTVANCSAFFASNKSGTKDKPIIVDTLDALNKPVLYGSIDKGYILHLYNCEYWNIKNIIFHDGAKGLILDNVQNSILDSIEVYNTGDEGVHFRDGSCNNTIKNSYIHDTGISSPGFGEGVYVGSADGTNKPDGSKMNQVCNYNSVLNTTFGPNIAAESVDIKENTIGTIVDNCIFNAKGTQSQNSTDSVINVKGNNCIITNNIVNRENNSNILWAFKVYQVSSSKANSGYNNFFGNNTVNMDTNVPSVISIQSNMIAYVHNNIRIPDGNWYTSTGKAVEYSGPLPIVGPVDPTPPNPPPTPLSPQISAKITKQKNNNIKGELIINNNTNTQYTNWYITCGMNVGDVLNSCRRFIISNDNNTIILKPEAKYSTLKIGQTINEKLEIIGTNLPINFMFVNV